MNTKITLRQLLIAAWVLLVPVALFAGYVAGRGGIEPHQMAPILLATLVLSIFVVGTMFHGEP